MLTYSSNPALLTDQDLDYKQFHCCGDEDLMFVKCPPCGHIMVFCYECDTLYPDLMNTAITEGLLLTREDDRFVCPACHVAFEDFYFVQLPDKYSPTADQVKAAGAGHLLAPHLR